MSTATLIEPARPTRVRVDRADDQPEGPDVRVRRGAELLDRVNPGWAQLILPELLDMRSCDMCILGQLYGNYTVGWMSILRSITGRRKIYRTTGYGFSFPEHLQLEALGRGEDIFAPLAAAWRDEIRSRLP